jgi:hypothetical protein
MSWKDEYIAKHGEEAYAKRLEHRRAWGQRLPGGEKQRSRDRRDEDPEKWRTYCRERREANPERWRAYSRERDRKNPERVKEHNRQSSRKGGKYYEKNLLYHRIGLQGKRNAIRSRHRNKWRQYKHQIAPDSQIHHSWRPGTAEYDGVALVEKDKHRHGIIDVIQILEGKITLLTEKEVRNGSRRKE